MKHHCSATNRAPLGPRRAWRIRVNCCVQQRAQRQCREYDQRGGASGPSPPPAPEGLLGCAPGNPCISRSQCIQRPQALFL
jgi:hypothetical protein